MISVVPRHATDFKINTLAQAGFQPTSTSNFVAFSLCMREKTTAAAAACPTGDASPVVGVQVTEDSAKFFLQIASTANTNTDA